MHKHTYTHLWPTLSPTKSFRGNHCYISCVHFQRYLYHNKDNNRVLKHCANILLYVKYLLCQALCWIRKYMV